MNVLPRRLFRSSPPDAFPDIGSALVEPNGLLAAGGDLSSSRLLCAYRKGIFPWYSDDQPILWWSPDPRMVLFPSRLKVSTSLRKKLRHRFFRVSTNEAFAAVVEGCAAPRANQPGTWITQEMVHAYQTLYELSYARSLECWQDDRLVGGLYGVSIGRVFFGESMFSIESDASKVALFGLCQQGYEFIDCQMPSAHLERLGAGPIARAAFARLLDRWCDAAPIPFNVGTLEYMT